MRKAVLSLAGLLSLAYVLGPERFGHLVAKTLVIPIAAIIALFPAWHVGCYVADKAALVKLDGRKTSEPGRTMMPIILGVLAAAPVFIGSTIGVWAVLQSWF